MKAITLKKYGLNTLQLQEVPKPAPKDNEVLIKVHAVSINDWDWGFMQGKPYITRLFTGLVKPKINIPGVDVAGTIEAIGKNIKKFKVGEEVYGDLSESGFGAFAEYVCAPEKALTIKPQSMSFEDAAAIPHAGALAYQALIEIGQLKEGQKLLINGAGGGVGTLGIQMIKDLNVEATGVDSTQKQEVMKAFGYQHMLDYKKDDFTKNSQQYDLIIDNKTSHSVFKYLKVLKPRGKYIMVGGTMWRVLQMVTLGRVISLLGKKKFKVLALKTNKGMGYINQLYEEGKIRPLIDGPYKLEEIPELVNYFGKGEHKGKVVVLVLI